MSSVRRVYVEKKSGFAVAARDLEHEIINYLGVAALKKVRILIRYDVENISDGVFEEACRTVFSEPPVDILYHEEFPLQEGEQAFAVEYLPGQFDQRADSAMQCVKLLKEDEDAVIRTATVYVVSGNISRSEFDSIKNYCINPVDSREAASDKPQTLADRFDDPADIAVFDGFTRMEDKELSALYASLNLAMTYRDFLHIRNYFKNEERRDPFVTEIRVLDTYWSDHCRHTTFLTEIKNVSFADGFYRTLLENSYMRYEADWEEICGNREDKFPCLMEMATLAARKLKKEGKADDLEDSDEVNACSIVVPVENDGKTEDWLINFKNETHNHPTEIEPFGGAATCLGGAIRDPLAGRTYVYQAMRVTGAADPRQPADRTLRGKLPQKKIVREAAHGYSSYGNQIGLATGYVREIYHPDYAAKRMEIGAVIGAAPKNAVIREKPVPGDVVILLGGRTGRDGIGGATGSSKAHTEASIEVCGAEVQKGNAPTERKIQRLFRRPEVSRLIRKCNDFGAGGVAVAIGELSEGLRIDLDRVPKKYAGLDGTEIAISESQERMAVVVKKWDAGKFIRYAAEENLEATIVAEVASEPRLRMSWRGKEIVNISRAFLDTNGAHQQTDVFVEMPSKTDRYFSADDIDIRDVKTKWLSVLSDLNCCSQKGLVEMFDSSVGAGSVLMPFGGKYQLTPTQVMAAKLPVSDGKTDTVTLMSYGYDPYLSKWSPYHGAVYAVIESVAKIVANGGEADKIRFTFQEYFRRMSRDPKRWSQPFAALLGAYDAQIGLGLPSIGGKDSMSGSFDEAVDPESGDLKGENCAGGIREIDVPPTLVSFAVVAASAKNIITPELKESGSILVLLKIDRNEYDIPDYVQIMDQYAKFYNDIKKGAVISACAVDGSGIAAALSKMAFGNRMGVHIEDDINEKDLFAPGFGDIIAEVPREKVSLLTIRFIVIGEVTDRDGFEYRSIEITEDEAYEAWSSTLEGVYKTHSDISAAGTAYGSYTGLKSDSKICPDGISGEDGTESGGIKHFYICKHKVARPRVFIPVFSGTNCEYDSKIAFERAGADVDVRVFRNLNAQDIRDSVEVFGQAIDKAQIIMFPGGFSAGDEPDGSAKFFAAAFRNAKMKDAVMKLLDERDGLVLGICNGFQALIKLGLVPEGRITTGQEKTSPTLTFNTIGRHISKMVYTKVVNNKSPWLSQARCGGVYANPASHTEGRFVADDQWLKRLFDNGQVATRYCSIDGDIEPDNEIWNVNGSYAAIEGITSPDGRVFGKMAHAERRGESVAVNIYGEQDLKIFESGVAYFR